MARSMDSINVDRFFFVLNRFDFDLHAKKKYFGAFFFQRDRDRLLTSLAPSS